MVAWRIENKLPLLPDYRSNGVHYNDLRKVAASEYRVDLCVSVEQDVDANPQGVISKVIPACRCAVARHYGSHDYVSAAHYMYEEWLPNSAEKLGEFPIFFHYVNVGPDLKDDEMITDVYLPPM
ncbi:GyrI-like domain-containing protein [Marinobacterium aestuarii]|uniref:AraC family transcriptional regulator n=1 Tax=Marinobacterium aestuarii TaxID=1821621 RepID=UPI000A04B854